MRRICLLVANCTAAAICATGQNAIQTAVATQTPSTAAIQTNPAQTAPSSWTDLGSYVGYLGFGFGPPVATIHNRVNTGWNFIAGFGPRLGGGFELPVDFTFQRYGAKDSIQVSGRTPISGNMKMWSLTLNPTYELVTAHNFGWYATVGYGLYNRRIQVTQATLVGGIFCDPFWGFCSPGVVPATAVLGSHSVYNGGWNFGSGFTFGPPRMKFFAEVRYHFMYTSPVRTETLPITFGVRW
ncbi:MAG: hypothetical protein ACRD1L_05500 [Terriglobales bacterium]